jgi:phospho-N-acetylmuramoyl-pentapeptide-transferase
LATTIVGISIATLSAFLWYNAFPAKVFMWDSWALALGGLIATLVYLLNMKLSIFIPFMILFGLFRVEMGSSFLQIVWKKYLKRKLFPIAPFHHLLQYRGMHETTIVMKFRLVQRILATVCVIMLFYQIL